MAGDGGSGFAILEQDVQRDAGDTLAFFAPAWIAARRVQPGWSRADQVRLPGSILSHPGDLNWEASGQER